MAAQGDGAAAVTVIELRPPTEADIPAIFGVLRPYNVHLLGPQAEADPELPPDAVLTVRNKIVDVDLNARALVADSDGEVLGVCCWGWLDRDQAAARTILLMVNASARGSGVGGALQRARMEAMWAAGARTIHTWSDDPAAVAWYQRHFGYRRLEEEPIHHALHRFHLGDRIWWAIHRGFADRTTVVHQVVDAPTGAIS